MVSLTGFPAGRSRDEHDIVRSIAIEGHDLSLRCGLGLTTGLDELNALTERLSRLGIQVSYVKEGLPAQPSPSDVAEAARFVVFLAERRLFRE